jgi:hypothetical protein
MLFGEQKYEPEDNIVAAAWTVRNRVSNGYGGGLWPTYQAQVENGQYQGIISPAQRNALAGGDKAHFEDLMIMSAATVVGLPLARIRGQVGETEKEARVSLFGVSEDKD